MKKESIPRYIDDQPQLLFWEVDEVAILSACVALGILFNLLPALVALGLGVIITFRRFKHHHMNGVLHHMCYWWGLLNLNSKFKNGLEREFFS